ncbi:hydroxymethylglutaryl-CoA reductase, degradative [Flavicella sp.]|uniref:hydroxymethylglutaryl-CoA reductase, degradative n=1 Tax=Flavicella sp. TaxID=2957742 RepID=UPI002618DDCB|nr:hydroxymethylglutaryl-CoA reductase, degradative [Flavicella sp.]MDG1805108.1 hydroxymethylglutaryl-CoA reductase, degradative [Flavicella sp.]
MVRRITGFSKFSKEEKIDWLVKAFFNKQSITKETLIKYWNTDEKLQRLHDDFIENTISNFYLPYGVAPNFIIDGIDYTIPMVIEESSVVAAASLIGKFWSTRGGFKTEILGTTKIGQVHFIYEGDAVEIEAYFKDVKKDLLASTESITANMRKRGGGILDIELRSKTEELDHYYQLHVTFETKDSMGANFINSCLEEIASRFEKEGIHIVMSILSNYVPECLVRAEVSCKVEELIQGTSEIDPNEYARKFKTAIDIANVEPHRAVTHNKGIMNGIDAVVLATGNDFRAIESCAHAYAAKDGRYKSLTQCEVKDGVFRFWIEIPLALGTVGGLTALHPMAKLSLELLQNPSAEELMKIIAVAGLAQNFAALRALTTTGIQKGHMKMHLMNILNQLGATNEEKELTVAHFEKVPVTHSAVHEFYKTLK